LKFQREYYQTLSKTQGIENSSEDIIGMFLEYSSNMQNIP
jgi:hypothetical protein